MMPEVVSRLDLNKVLMAVIVSILGWTVKTTQDLTVQVAVIEERLGAIKEVVNSQQE